MSLRIQDHILVVLAQRKESSSIFDIALIGTASVLIGIVLGEVAKNFITFPTDQGWGFASQQKKDEGAIPKVQHGPEGQTCKGTCSGPCTSGQCYDQSCGKLISCHSHSHTQTHTPDTTGGTTTSTTRPKKPNDGSDRLAEC